MNAMSTVDSERHMKEKGNGSEGGGWGIIIKSDEATKGRVGKRSSRAHREVDVHVRQKSYE